jgi:hypothetical protein
MLAFQTPKTFGMPISCSPQNLSSRVNKSLEYFLGTCCCQPNFGAHHPEIYHGASTNHIFLVCMSLLANTICNQVGEFGWHKQAYYNQPKRFLDESNTFENANVYSNRIQQKIKHSRSQK